MAESGRGGVLNKDGERIHPIDPQGQKAERYIGERNLQRTQPLIRSQQVAAQGGTTCYIYNVSPIFRWTRPVKGFGTFTIPKAPSIGDPIIDKKTGEARKATEEDIKGLYKLSAPIVINHSYVNSYDKGDTRRIPYVEYGEEIAESIVGNSKMYPADLTMPTNNLENWGVFITYGTPFDELPKEEQATLYTQAMAAHQARCFEKVVKADELYPRAPQAVLEVHRKCALFIGEERPWVTNRAPRIKADMVECPFCTSDIKATALKCPNCREIVNPDAYEKRVAKGRKKSEE